MTVQQSLPRRLYMPTWEYSYCICNCSVCYGPWFTEHLTSYSLGSTIRYWTLCTRDQTCRTRWTVLESCFYYNSRDISVISRSRKHESILFKYYRMLADLCSWTSSNSHLHLSVPRSYINVVMYVCKCASVPIVKLPAAAMSDCGTFNDLPVPSDHCCQNLSKEKQVEIQQALVGLRTYWCESSGPAYLLVGDEVCTALTNGAIEYIVENFYNITTKEQLRELGVVSYSYCQQIISLLSSLKWTIIATIIVINFCVNYRLLLVLLA